MIISVIRFIKQHAMNMLLSQESLLFDFQKEIPITLPLPSGKSYPILDKYGCMYESMSLVNMIGSKSSTSSKLSYSMPTRRFVEQRESWNNLRVLVTQSLTFIYCMYVCMYVRVYIANKILQ